MDYKLSYDINIPFEFRGEGRAYFRIWVVNLFLSIITLGIYSAWAKVRSNRYFYSHLYLDGTSFEYLANPVSILIGRVIAVFLFVSYHLVSQYTPSLSLWFLLALIPIVPWVMLKSLQFRARNSAYRNLRFHFHGEYKEAFFIMGIYPALVYGPFILSSMYIQSLIGGVSTSSAGDIWIPLLSASFVSLFFLGFALQNYYNFVISCSSYGKSRFEFHSTVGEYYSLFVKIFFASIGMFLLLIIVMGIAIFFLKASDGSSTGYIAEILGGIGGIGGLGLYIWAIAMFITGTTNLFYNGIAIPSWYTFESRVTTWGLFKVYFVNTLLIVLTAGFYIPFAKIRLINYRVSAMKFVSTQPLDGFVFDQDAEVAALGQEMGDVFDLGVSL